jgi:hypothetical protein
MIPPLVASDFENLMFSIMEDMTKVTVTLYMNEENKKALQRLDNVKERSLSKVAVLILK